MILVKISRNGFVLNLCLSILINDVSVLKPKTNAKLNYFKKMTNSQKLIKKFSSLWKQLYVIKFLILFLVLGKTHTLTGSISRKDWNKAKIKARTHSRDSS